MQESDLNTMIFKSFISQGGWAYKIPDPHKSVARVSSPRPFDLLGVTQKGTYYLESKLLKGYQAFNFKRIEQHQLDNLNRIKRTRPECFALVTLGVWVPRKVFDILFFDIRLINYLIEQGKPSLLKKDLELIRDAGFASTIRLGEFEVENIERNTITIEKWNSISGGVEVQKP